MHAGLPGVGVEAGYRLSDRWALGARAELSGAAAAAYVVTPYVLRESAELRFAVTPGIGLRNCGSRNTFTNESTGCDYDGPDTWDITGLALVSVEVVFGRGHDWSIGGEAGH